MKGNKRIMVDKAVAGVIMMEGKGKFLGLPLKYEN
jgi:hypothetical protein